MRAGTAEGHRDRPLPAPVAPASAGLRWDAVGPCTGMLWDPALVSSEGPERNCSGHSIPMLRGSSTSMLQNLPPSLPPSPSSPSAPAPPATNSCSPSAPQMGQTGPASCSWHRRTARALDCCQPRAGRDRENAVIRRMPGRDQERCAGRSCLGDGASNACSAPRAPRWGREAPVGR